MTMERAIIRQKVRRVASHLDKLLGHPEPPRRKAAPLDMLVATILSQNTNDRNSHRAYLALREKYPTWDLVMNAPTRGIASAIRSGGMSIQKSGRIKEMLSALMSRFGSLDLRSLRTKTDDEIFEILLSINGVGVKTVACVLLFSLGRDVFPVDTHVHRICGRLGLAPGCTTPEKTFEWMKGLLPRSKAYAIHTNLIRFGRTICRAKNPLCGHCPLYDLCVFRGKKECRALRRPVRQGDKFRFMVLDNV
jgi:endonuclease III